jgi:hypothetical protein
MTGVQVGATVAAFGYALAIWGGVLLYRNTAPDRGHGLRAPRIPGGEATEWYANDDKGIAGRLKGNKLGFLLLTAGSTLQLIGTLISGYS